MAFSVFPSGRHRGSSAILICSYVRRFVAAFFKLNAFEDKLVAGFQLNFPIAANPA
jgi:hypothetical protein